MLIGEDEVEEEQMLIPNVETEIEGNATLHHLYMYAFRGSAGIATICFEGEIYGTNVQVLLDGGSSDSFIHPRIVQHLNVVMEPFLILRVLVGTGQLMMSQGYILSCQFSFVAIHCA